MILLDCPHCGPRNSDEFTFNGEIVPRPDVEATDAAEWRRYLYMKSNGDGWQTERWFHLSGCRRFLLVERNLDTNEIASVIDYSDKS